MAENIITFLIFLLVSIIMVGLGISQIKSKTPVGFYTGEKPPKREQITDVEAWNKKHGLMWILYGATIMGSYIACAFVEAEMIALIVFLGVIVGAIPVMMFYHNYLQKKYMI